MPEIKNLFHMGSANANWQKSMPGDTLFGNGVSYWGDNLTHAGSSVLQLASLVVANM